jgi:antitoxin HicB
MMTQVQPPIAHRQSYTIVLEPAEEGGYVVTCPALPGLVTEGDTLREARERAKDAVRLYLESLIEDGLPIPEGDENPREVLREQVTVSIDAA